MIGRKITDKTITCKVIKPILPMTDNQNTNTNRKQYNYTPQCMTDNDSNTINHYQPRYFGVNNNQDNQISVNFDFSTNNNKGQKQFSFINKSLRQQNVQQSQSQSQKNIKQTYSRNVTHFFINNKEKPLNIQPRKNITKLTPNQNKTYQQPLLNQDFNNSLIIQNETLKNQSSNLNDKRTIEARNKNKKPQVQQNKAFQKKNIHSKQSNIIQKSKQRALHQINQKTQKQKQRVKVNKKPQIPIDSRNRHQKVSQQKRQDILNNQDSRRSLHEIRRSKQKQNKSLNQLQESEQLKMQQLTIMNKQMIKNQNQKQLDNKQQIASISNQAQKKASLNNILKIKLQKQKVKQKRYLSVKEQLEQKMKINRSKQMQVKKNKQSVHSNIDKASQQMRKSLKPQIRQCIDQLQLRQIHKIDKKINRNKQSQNQDDQDNEQIQNEQRFNIPQPIHQGLTPLQKQKNAQQIDKNPKYNKPQQSFDNIEQLQSFNQFLYPSQYKNEKQLKDNEDEQMDIEDIMNNSIDNSKLIIKQIMENQQMQQSNNESLNNNSNQNDFTFDQRGSKLITKNKPYIQSSSDQQQQTQAKNNKNYMKKQLLPKTEKKVIEVQKTISKNVQKQKISSSKDTTTVNNKIQKQIKIKQVSNNSLKEKQKQKPQQQCFQSDQQQEQQQNQKLQQYLIRSNLLANKQKPNSNPEQKHNNYRAKQSDNRNQKLSHISVYSNKFTTYTQTLINNGQSIILQTDQEYLQSSIVKPNDGSRFDNNLDERDQNHEDSQSMLRKRQIHYYTLKNTQQNCIEMETYQDFNYQQQQSSQILYNHPLYIEDSSQQSSSDHEQEQDQNHYNVLINTNDQQTMTNQNNLMNKMNPIENQLDQLFQLNLDSLLSKNYINIHQ